MTDDRDARTASRVLGIDGLEALLNELHGRGFEVYGPQVVDGVIAHDRLESVADLPLGVTDVQSGGRYRLRPRSDGARFGYAVGPQSWKELLHPPRSAVWTMRRQDGELQIEMHEPSVPRRAFVGVRPCELAAIVKQDRVLLEGPHPDPTYAANRHDVFLVAVNCGDPADTCFCTSMGTGPAAGPGHDLVMTELVDGDDVRYVVEVGSEQGRMVLDAVLDALTSSATSSGTSSASRNSPGSTESTEPPMPMEATEAEWRSARQVVEQAADSIGRRLDTTGIKELIYDNLDSPQWDEIAERCLACGNCTLACPTCFCTNLEDVTDLTGDHSDRWRVWDSCFSLDFSHMGPGPVRDSTASRYRQWFTHKLATWIDQFDESGCVGCGRCITWCPVGIDLTAEIAIMAERADR